MHECLLCEKDMKKSKETFGSGCINNIFNFLDITKPKRCKDKEALLYKNIMQQTNTALINKNRKIWLTDRYLTFKYLNELHYGNFDRIKNEIDEDIKSINRIKKFEELKTTREIKLKEAYDLYKKEGRFNENLNKLRNEEIKDEKELKALISSFSFIFNMYKNRNQYEKNSFKAMQYAFWQTVIEVGGRYFNYELAAELLQHSLNENPTDIIIKDEKIIDNIKRDQNFIDKMNDIINRYGKNNEFYISLDNDESMAFENNDLYFAIHNADIEMSAKKSKELEWEAEITLSDTFDFTKWKKLLDYISDANSIPKSMISSTLYNLAFISQKLGVIKEYKVIAKLKFKWQEGVIE